MKTFNFYKIEIWTFLLITFIGLINKEVSVFYIIYLFWFQEFIRTLFDVIFLLKQAKTVNQKFEVLKSSFGNFFLLFIYFVFIVLIFGFMLNSNDSSLLGKNILVLFFKNWFFNINLILFSVEYFIFKHNQNTFQYPIVIFNRRHIILHLSIILGAIIQLILLPKWNFDKYSIASFVVILPFLLLKFYFSKPS